MLLSTRVVEVERLVKAHPKVGRLLQRLRDDLWGSIASILTINTVANNQTPGLRV